MLCGTAVVRCLPYHGRNWLSVNAPDRLLSAQTPTARREFMVCRAQSVWPRAPDNCTPARRRRWHWVRRAGLTSTYTFMHGRIVMQQHLSHGWGILPLATGICPTTA